MSTKLRVGDKVRVLRNDVAGTREKKGQILTVTEVDSTLDDGSYCFRTNAPRREDGCDTWHFSSYDIDSGGLEYVLISDERCDAEVGPSPEPRAEDSDRSERSVYGGLQGSWLTKERVYQIWSEANPHTEKATEVRRQEVIELLGHIRAMEERHSQHAFECEQYEKRIHNQVDIINDHAKLLGEKSLQVEALKERIKNQARTIEDYQKLEVKLRMEIDKAGRTRELTGDRNFSLVEENNRLKQAMVAMMTGNLELAISHMVSR